MKLALKPGKHYSTIKSQQINNLRNFNNSIYCLLVAVASSVACRPENAERNAETLGQPRLDPGEVSAKMMVFKKDAPPSQTGAVLQKF